MISVIIKFFDKLEDHIRIRLSHWPILYAMVGAVGIILVWKGIWEATGAYPFLFGLPSAILGFVLLLMTGLLVQFFIGDAIILSGITHGKKLAEKTETEVEEEEVSIHHIVIRLKAIEDKLDDFMCKVDKVPTTKKNEAKI
jgi:hypothetical protein